MDKCYVILSGGIGNQLFQIANGFAYSRDHDKELVLTSQQWTASQGRNPLEYKDGLYSNFNFGIFPSGCSVITETVEQPLKYISGDVILDGYFQSLKYFHNHKEDFISKLTIPEINLSFLQPKNVAFHVRRGDYIAFRNIHLVCGTDYFQQEFERFKDYQINVFTDSPDIIYNEFKEYNFNIIKSNSNYPELSEMMIMSNHNNIVGSNSSFSWWASLLGKKKDKIIFPSRWYNHKDEELIYSYRDDMTLKNPII